MLLDLGCNIVLCTVLFERIAFNTNNQLYPSDGQHKCKALPKLFQTILAYVLLKLSIFRL